MPTLGGLIKDFRIQKNISQTQIAYKMGWSDSSQLSRIEQGKIRPSKNMLDKIASAMNLDSVENASLYLSGGYTPLKTDIDNVKRETNDIVASWPYPIMVLSQDYRIVDFNKHAQDLYNLTNFEEQMNFLDVLFSESFLNEQKNNEELQKILRNKVEMFKLSTKEYSNQKWFKAQIKSLMDSDLFKKMWSEDNKEEISDINYETISLLKSNKTLQFHIFKKTCLSDPRFFYEFYNPVNTETMEEYK